MRRLNHFWKRIALTNLVWVMAFEAMTATVPLPLVQVEGGYLIDLPTVLLLARANNIDIQVARQKLNEAKALQENARLQFFPTIAPGITYRRHDNLIQAVDGVILEVHKQSWAPGVTISAEWQVAEASFNALAARQNTEAAKHQVEGQNEESIFAGVQHYFDLQFASAARVIAEEAISISTNYLAQLTQAVEGGMAFKGDELRLQVLTEKNRVALRQALEQENLVSARLVQHLNLDPEIHLKAVESDMVPMVLVQTNSELKGLINEALATHPAVKQGVATLEAARLKQKASTLGPFFPSVGAQVFLGGLGGDSEAGRSRFGDQESYYVGLSWKIGPGGLFDNSRKRLADSRYQTVSLTQEKIRDEIARQIVEGLSRVQSLSDQMEILRRALSAAEKSLKLAQERKEYAVGAVLENIQAQQDLTRARFDYFKAVNEYNKIQYALHKALGKPIVPTSH